MRAEPIVRRAVPEDAAALAAVIRREEAFKILDADGCGVEKAILDSITRSAEAWVWEVDGEPACMVGIVMRSIIAGPALGWLFTTQAVERHKRTFWVGSKRMLDQMLATYGRIEGHCDARFLSSVQWLERLGFTLDEEPMDFMGVPFRHFSKELAK